MQAKTRLAIVLLVGLALLSTAGRAFALQPNQPNIIVILADDLGVETLGVYGGSSYETPELDRIVAEGMRFENGHSQPLCTPTRVKLMTGLHNFRNYREFSYLDTGDVTFAHMLAQAGYRTVISGKWQLTNNLFVVHEGTSPQQAGFDEHRLWQLRREGRGSRYWGPALVTNDKKETWGEDIFGPDLINDFVLEVDPYEMTNLANAPGYGERIEAMLSQLRAWMEDQGDRGLQTEVEAPQHRSRPR